MHPVRLIATTALALLGPSAFAQGGPPGGAMPATPVEASRPQVSTVSDTITAVGSLRAAESVVIKPEMAGRIEKIHFEEGQVVAAGAPLVTLDAALMQSDLREWEANVAKSRREAQRAEEMIAKKLVAQSDLDAKRAALAVDEARLSSAKTRLSKTVLRAPFTGVVGLRQVSPGAYVNIGDPLVTLTQIDPMKLDFRLPENSLGQVAPGQSLQVTLDAFPGQTFVGTISAIDPQLDPASRTVMLRATLKNTESRLRPGLFARVLVEYAARANAFVVPEQALWPMGDKQFVYVIRAGKAELVPVTIGVRRAGTVEIKTGLSAEDEVITAGQVKIGPGAAVKAIAK